VRQSIVVEWAVCGHIVLVEAREGRLAAVKGMVFGQGALVEGDNSAAAEMVLDQGPVVVVLGDTHLPYLHRLSYLVDGKDTRLAVVLEGASVVSHR